MKNNKTLNSYFWTLVGTFLFCAGLNFFIVPVGLYNGGTVGTSQIIRTVLSQKIALPEGIDIAGIINLGFNTPLLYLAYKEFGKDTFVKTLFSVLLQSVFLALLPIPKTPILQDRLSACIIGGAVAGVGVGITLKAGGSGGGSDILGLYGTAKIKNFSVGKMNLAINAFVYGLCAILFELPTAIYSVIYSIVYSMAIDKTHSQNIPSSVMIFTKKEDLHKKIMANMRRGTTYWKGVGGFTETDTYVLVTALSKYEVAVLKKVLEKEDPNAFVIVSEGQEMIGNYEVHL